MVYCLAALVLIACHPLLLISFRPASFKEHISEGQLQALEEQRPYTAVKIHGMVAHEQQDHACDQAEPDGFASAVNKFFARYDRPFGSRDGRQQGNERERDSQQSIVSRVRQTGPRQDAYCEEKE